MTCGTQYSTYQEDTQLKKGQHQLFSRSGIRTVGAGAGINLKTQTKTQKPNKKWKSPRGVQVENVVTKM